MKKKKMKVNYKIALTIVLAAMINIIGLAAYLFDLIPSEWHKVYFYNLDRFYILLILGLFWYLVIDKTVKISIGTSFFIYLVLTINANVKHFVTLNKETNEWMWILFVAVSFLICLITAYYVSRRQIIR